jgi:hypothetical protein
MAREESASLPVSGPSLVTASASDKAPVAGSVGVSVTMRVLSAYKQPLAALGSREAEGAAVKVNPGSGAAARLETYTSA